MAPLLLSIFLFLTGTHTATSLSILKPVDSFEVGSSITVECSVDTMDVPIDGNKFSLISVVEMLYHLDSSTDLNPKRLALLSGINFDPAIPAPWKDPSIPSGKAWTITFPTDQEMTSAKYQRDTMKITAVLSDSTCDDSGHYFCKVTDTNGNAAEKSQSTNASVSASDLAMNVVPDFADAGVLQATYKSNATITVTCNADGMSDDKFFWKRKCPNKNDDNINPSFLPDPTFQPWPVLNQIGTHTKSNIPNNDCGLLRHSQTLTFEMTQELHECMVQCQFGLRDNHQDTLHTNFTFLLEGDAVTTDSPTGAASTSSASNKDLIIGLTVSLLLVLIIIIAILIYVCWWRKRTPQDKYKDEPDVGPDNNMHAAPPVFYSKPHKTAPKDDAGGEKLRRSVGEDPYDSDVPPKAYYDNEGRESDYAPRQKYSSAGRPRSQQPRRSERGSGDYYNYDDDYNPDKPRHRSSDDGPYASADVSRSEDESESGRPRPKPKRRTKLPPQEEDEKDALHYADLDLKRDGDSEQRGRYNRNRRNRRSRGQSQDDEEDQPVQYASIRV